MTKIRPLTLTAAGVLAATALVAAPGVASAQDAGMATSCGDVLIVLDRSQSMSTCSLNGMTKWQHAQTALRTILQQNPTVPYGLFTFPSDMAGGNNNLCATGRFVVEITANDAPQITQALGRLNPGGGTPTGASLEAVRDYTGWMSGLQHFVIFITDGQPN